ncbi:MAG: tetratricopeptide repeat protein [Bryobacteraceae bacterium]
MQRWPVLLFLFVSGFQALRAETVLVLPFFNQSETPNLDWIGESVAETVRESLDNAGVLALDRQDRLEAFRRLSLRPNAVLTHASVIKAGESLDASQVIYGQFEVTPSTMNQAGSSRGTLRITGRILNVKRYRQGPEFSESGPLEDLASLSARFSWKALTYLEPKVAPSEEEFLRSRPRVRLDARESYIRGLLATDAEQKMHFFTQAARLDNSYSQPCFELGKAYWARKDYRLAAGWLKRVNGADPHYLEAQFFLGLCNYQTGDYAGAQKCFETVAATVPLNEVYNDLGAAQIRRDPNGAIESFRKALEGDSADPIYHFNLAYALWKAGQFETAAAEFRAVLERNPNDDDAAAMLIRAERREAPRPGSEGRERLKTNYEETAFRQLKAELESKKN